MHQQQTAFENIVGKGEIACMSNFSFFPHCFLLGQIIASLFVHIFDIMSLFAAESEEPKIGISGKGSCDWLNVELTANQNLLLKKTPEKCNVRDQHSDIPL